MNTRVFNQIRKYCSSQMKWLFVAEKNDAAKTIAGFLSRGQSQRRDGIATFNKIYEFETQVLGQQGKILMTSVSGHLLNKDFIGTFRKWNGCNADELFDAPIHKTCDDRNDPIKRQLEREARTCNGLVIWTDCDREGENIGFEIIEVCTAINNRLKVYRAKFSDMTAASLTRAMNTLQAPDERISQAVEIRSELDLRIGAAFTRFQTMRLQQRFPNQVKQGDLVSYGSCQIPTLGFVVDRYREIERFIKNDFWKIKLTHKINALTVDFSWGRSRFFDEACCEAILQLCKADGRAVITNVTQKPKNKWRPQPMDTIELEKSGSRKLKRTAKQIMTVAEKLYTQGLISYPRTETNKFSKDMNLTALVELQVPHRDWGGFAARVLEWGANPRNGNKSDQAHPPIHPTKFTDTLVGDEKLVYDLVTRHFLACVSKDAVGSETIAYASIGGEEFQATGLVILERNYLDVYVYDRWSGKEIHNYEMGNSFVPTKLDIERGQTSPPNLLTEADLISLMEKHGIGTDATHADHIQTVKDRGYIGEINNGHLVPGKLGMGLVEGYELMNLTLTKPELRAQLEIDLKGICDGVKNPQEVLRQQIEIYRECFQKIMREVNSLDRAMATRFQEEPEMVAALPDIPVTIIHDILKCPKCRANTMVVKQKKDNSGSFISCLGYPNCKNAIWLQDDVKEISSLDEKCTNCGGENHKIRLKFKHAAMLGMVDEKPEFSRIDHYYYITCLLCDSKLRTLLRIPHDAVKNVGNMIGAASNAVHHAPRNNQARNFGTNAAPPPARPPPPPPGNNTQNRRSNWFDSDDNNDDNRPGGSGAVALPRWGNQNNPNTNNQNQKPTTSKTVKCNCGQFATRLVCKKEGANLNRAFLKCPKNSCKFFQWEDTMSNNNQQGTSGYAGGGNNQVRTARKCGICKLTGHNRTNCPNKN